MLLFSCAPKCQERQINEDDSEHGHGDDEGNDEQAHLLGHNIQQQQQDSSEEQKNDAVAAAAAALAKLGVPPPSSTVPLVGGAAPLPTLSEVSLEVKPGELVCVYGPTGCGKSTLLLSLLGEVRRVEGTVEVCILMFKVGRHTEKTTT